VFDEYSGKDKQQESGEHKLVAQRAKTPSWHPPGDDDAYQQNGNNQAYSERKNSAGRSYIWHAAVKDQKAYYKTNDASDNLPVSGAGFHLQPQSLMAAMIA
jgi:hypothetical protein